MNSRFLLVLFILFFSKNSTIAQLFGGQSLPQKKLGLISSLNCVTANNLGLLTEGIVANNVSSILSYSNGNGGVYDGQTTFSTGVLGLTATLNEGIFENGDGFLTYTITGIPSNSGTANFLLDIGGVICILGLNVSSAPLQVGDLYQGGIIASLDASGTHGLIVSTNEYNGVQGCYGNNAWSLSDGNTNTFQSFNVCNDNTYAIGKCWNLSLNGYSDWYLPAKNQLSIIYQNLISQNVLSMTGLYYWSSTSNSSNWAWALRSNGTWNAINKLGSQQYFRAVRNF